MMRFLLFLIVVALSGSAGFGGGWWYYTQYLPAQDAQEEEAGKPAEDEGATPAFVNIGPFTVPVLGGERVEQFVTLVVAVEVRDLTVADRVRIIGPRLTDAYITALYGAIAAGAVLEGGIVDVPQLKNRLVEASERVLGKDVARDVLVQVVSQRPM